mmetsp:Transcript_35041/g.85265  ORF Transcript_35041/g.85265 Transcript_35041/m.85265 type:complete len:264 (+) Transcript_35041:3920-4711(+)
MIDFLMRKKRALDHAIAPAMGGWFLKVGGISWLESKSLLTSWTSSLYRPRMSLNLSIICLLIESRVLMCLNFCSRSKAPSADRSFLKLSLMKVFVASSILATSSLKRCITASQLAWKRRSKMSKGTVSRGTTRPSTRLSTSSMPCESPVTALSSGPRMLLKSSRTCATMWMFWQHVAMYSVRSNSLLRSNSQRWSLPDSSIFWRTLKYVSLHFSSTLSALWIFFLASCGSILKTCLTSSSAATRSASSKAILSIRGTMRSSVL